MKENKLVIISKTYNRLNIMRKSRTFLDRYSRNIYISFIRPLMEYADVIWELIEILIQEESRVVGVVNNEI
jgi:hypothetical protein